MLGSLRARLIVSFAVVVALAVFLAGAGALFLLRDEEQQTARERYGRQADQVHDTVRTISGYGGRLGDISPELDRKAGELGARVLLVDSDRIVVHDTDGVIRGRQIASFEDANVVDDHGLRYQWTNYEGDGDDLALFSAAPAEADSPTFAAVPYDVYVAVPQSELSSAWLDLAPRLALAGAIALAVSFAVAYIISRSISGPLARITAASQQMAQGNYDVHIPIRGQDEVGRLSEAFNAMAREVSGSQRTMKDLLANVSHELKTPLTSIQGFSQAILDGAVPAKDDVEESVRIINEEANRMRGLVDDLLLLSQIESGQAEMEHGNVDIAELLRRSLERFQWALRDGDIRSGVSIASLPLVNGDGRRLEQVFSNLLENAVRHTPPGGVLTVRAGVERGGKVVIGVHNTGSFIPSEDLPRVFERFFQVDRARARKGGSSGLGLAIVSEIVEAHDGSVRAVSDQNTGTEFIVTLNTGAAAEQGKRASSTTAARTKRAQRKREAPAPNPNP